MKVIFEFFSSTEIRFFFSDGLFEKITFKTGHK